MRRGRARYHRATFLPLIDLTRTSATRHRRAFNCYDVPASRGDYAPILFIYIFQ